MDARVETTATAAKNMYRECTDGARQRSGRSLHALVVPLLELEQRPPCGGRELRRARRQFEPVPRFLRCASVSGQGDTEQIMRPRGEEPGITPLGVVDRRTE